MEPILEDGPWGGESSHSAAATGQEMSPFPAPAAPALPMSAGNTYSNTHSNTHDGTSLPASAASPTWWQIPASTSLPSSAAGAGAGALKAESQAAVVAGLREGMVTPNGSFVDAQVAGKLLQTRLHEVLLKCCYMCCSTCHRPGCVGSPNDATRHHPSRTGNGAPQQPPLAANASMAPAGTGSRGSLATAPGSLPQVGSSPRGSGARAGGMLGV